MSRGGKDVAVHLAVGRQGQGVEGDEGGGDHVGGETTGEEATQLTAGGLGLSRWHEVGHQQPVPRLALPGHHHCLGHGRMSGEGRLHLPALDAEAPHLHLLVEAAQELDVAVGQATDQVAGAVQAGTRTGAERVGDEALGRELGAVEVAVGHADPADVQLARRAWRHGLAPLVEDVDGGVGDGLADGRVPPLTGIGLAGGRLVQRGHHARLGGAVGVEPTDAVACHPQPGAVHRPQGLLAPDDDQPERRWRLLPQRHQVAHPLVPISGGEVEHADLLAVEPVEPHRPQDRELVGA